MTCALTCAAHLNWLPLNPIKRQPRQPPKTISPQLGSDGQSKQPPERTTGGQQVLEALLQQTPPKASTEEPHNSARREESPPRYAHHEHSRKNDEQVLKLNGWHRDEINFASHMPDSECLQVECAGLNDLEKYKLYAASSSTIAMGPDKLSQETQTLVWASKRGPNKLEREEAV
ncbi:hypothetical protein Cgig2_021637 [Carnegiea gigantea]|uniref:Uncharacterized protein n=1 Tax=Carnegiea gigantea TaxID=171969 RepID=A0A9Q1GVA9_9CARY|nr:hypothetical protein Cgig2_021637 [Carnegiea gigantea]